MKTLSLIPIVLPLFSRRFCHNYDTYLDERKIVKRGKKITDKELKEIVEKYGNKNKGFSCPNSTYNTFALAFE